LVPGAHAAISVHLIKTSARSRAWISSRGGGVGMLTHSLTTPPLALPWSLTHTHSHACTRPAHMHRARLLAIVTDDEGRRGGGGGGCSDGDSGGGGGRAAGAAANVQPAAAAATAEAVAAVEGEQCQCTREKAAHDDRMSRVPHPPPMMGANDDQPCGTARCGVDDGDALAARGEGKQGCGKRESGARVVPPRALRNSKEPAHALEKEMRCMEADSEVETVGRPTRFHSKMSIGRHTGQLHPLGAR
jgi:hypothetical protein